MSILELNPRRLFRMFDAVEAPIKGLWGLSSKVAGKKFRIGIHKRTGHLVTEIFEHNQFTPINHIDARGLSIIRSVLEREGLLAKDMPLVLNFENMSMWEVGNFFRKLVRLQEMDNNVLSKEDIDVRLKSLDPSSIVFDLVPVVIRQEASSVEGAGKPDLSMRVGVLRATAAIRLLLDQCIGKNKYAVNSARAVVSISPEDAIKLKVRLRQVGITALFPFNDQVASAIARIPARFSLTQVRCFLAVIEDAIGIQYFTKQFGKKDERWPLEPKFRHPDMGIVLIFDLKETSVKRSR